MGTITQTKANYMDRWNHYSPHLHSSLGLQVWSNFPTDPKTFRNWDCASQNTTKHMYKGENEKVKGGKEKYTSCSNM